MVICSEPISLSCDEDNKCADSLVQHKPIESANQEQPKRRVLTSSSRSLLFQRARALIQTEPRPDVASNKELSERPKKQQHDDMVKTEKEMDEKPSAEDKNTALTRALIEKKPQQEQQQQTRISQTQKLKDRKGPPPLIGIGAIFQRAIQETQNQIGVQQPKMMMTEKRKRIFNEV